MIYSGYQINLIHLLFVSKVRTITNSLVAASCTFSWQFSWSIFLSLEIVCLWEEVFWILEQVLKKFIYFFEQIWQWTLKKLELKSPQSRCNVWTKPRFSIYTSASIRYLPIGIVDGEHGSHMFIPSPLTLQHYPLALANCAIILQHLNKTVRLSFFVCFIHVLIT